MSDDPMSVSGDYLRDEARKAETGGGDYIEGSKDVAGRDIVYNVYNYNFYGTSSLSEEPSTSALPSTDPEIGGQDAEDLIIHYKRMLMAAQHMQGDALVRLGDVSVALGRVREAASYYEQALAIARILANPDMERSVLGKLRSAYTVLAEIGE